MNKTKGHNTKHVIPAIGVSHTTACKYDMSFDEMFDFTAEVYFHFYCIQFACFCSSFRFSQPIYLRLKHGPKTTSAYCSSLVRPKRGKTCPRQGASSRALRERLRRSLLTSRGGGRGRRFDAIPSALIGSSVLPGIIQRSQYILYRLELPGPSPRRYPCMKMKGSTNTGREMRGLDHHIHSQMTLLS